MLVGCYLLTGAASREGGGRLAHVLPILGWLNVYECALIGLSAILVRRGIVRDAWTLLAVETFFLADATNVVAETITASQTRWAATTLALGVLTLAKIVAISKVLGLRLSLESIGTLAFPATLSLLVPGGLDSLRRTGAMLDLPLYGAWWAIALGLLLAVLRGWPEPAGAVDARTELGRSFLRALLVAVNAGFVGHVLAIHWLHDTHLYACALSAPLLVLAIAVVRAPRAREAPRARVLVPAIAVVLSIPWPDEFGLEMGFTFSPLRAALVIAALTHVYDYLRHRQAWILMPAAGFVTAALGGPTLGAAWDRWAALLHGLGRHGRALLPRTARAWGALLVASAYVLLGLGAWSSLRDREASTPLQR
jgi:hypothetical protein